MKSNRRFKVVLFLGLQGSGKGTQASILSRKYGVPVISPGAVFREEIAKGSELGRLIASFVSQGKLVPPRVMHEVMRVKLPRNRCGVGVILDGYPRSVAQARELARFCPIDLALALRISDHEALRRLRGRRVCSVCGENYHVTERPSRRGRFCERCGGKLMVRQDDTPAAISRRLRTYHKETEPVIDYYRKKGVLIEIDGEQAILTVHRAIVRALGLNK